MAVNVHLQHANGVQQQAAACPDGCGRVPAIKMSVPAIARVAGRAAHRAARRADWLGRRRVLCWRLLGPDLRAATTATAAIRLAGSHQGRAWHGAVWTGKGMVGGAMLWARSLGKWLTGGHGGGIE